MKELILGFYSHCVATMRDVEVDKVKLAMKPVRSLYGESRCRTSRPWRSRPFGSNLIKSGLAISTIRDRMGIIRRMIAWGVEHEMAPADSLQRIEAVGGLRCRSGRSEALAEDPAGSRRKTSWRFLPIVNPTVRAMVEIQALTGMRPGEVWIMTTGQIDRTPDRFGNWRYSPDQAQDRRPGTTIG